jgi:uncharacterized membrane protein (DUF4010 family)
MTESAPAWPYLPALARLGLALALGLLVGFERERQGKEAGVRTFTFAALLGAAGGLLGDTFAVVALALLGLLAVLLTVETIRTGEGAEITTAAALLLMGFIGVLAGDGHIFTPTALAIATTALLAWKKPLRGFIRGVTDAELKSAIQLAIIAFVVYPVLPAHSVDPWHLIYPRDAWVTVILIAGLGFASYLLLKRYGTRGLEVAGFLGGLVNSTVAVSELATRARATDRARDVTFRGALLATGAMLIRNAVILGLLAPPAVLAAAGALGLMIAGTGAAAWLGHRHRGAGAAAPPLAADAAAIPVLESPFALRSVLSFGIVFLVLQVLGNLAERAAGPLGFYAVSAIGGLVSSASAVASAANLARSNAIPPHEAAIGTVLACLASTLVDLPVVARIARDRPLTYRIAWALCGVALLGAVGLTAQALLLSH